MSEAERSLLRRTSFGVLFQFGQLIPEMTVVENVALPLLMAGRRRREALETASSVLDRLGIAECRTTRPPSISGGQAQRAALARAIISGPAVVFADEPTGALDLASGQLVLDALSSLTRGRGAAVVLITHDQHVASIADRVIGLRDGTIVADPDELTAAPG
jgi:putative ABC transport system ATP-binding protein